MKILIQAPAWVGDMVMAHSLVGLLAAQDPDLHCELVAPAATAPLGARMPHVAAVHLLDVGHGAFGLRARLALARALRDRAFDRAYVLPNSWKSALVPALARIPRRIGFVGEFRHGLLNDARRLDAQALPRMVDRFAALAGSAGAPVPAAASIPAPVLHADAALAAGLRRRLDLTADAPVLACCPGAEFGPSKRWPPAHFARLAERQVAEGWQVWLFGSPADAAATAAIRAALPASLRARVVDLAGRTTLTEAVDLLGEATAVVSNDSGLMHVAGALARPVVAVYGSTSPAFTPPLGTLARVVSLELACAPCFQRHCPLGHLACLRELQPETVAAALDDLLRAASPT
ncbi:MAG TPA: lipopolysaccharide heptosyltransferase II [Pseudomonadales bacterium]|nr:lipopolysaccharide heptosyltransferase II [Pseudomonadales bacterium]